VDLNEIIKDAPTWVPATIIGVIITGMSTHIAVQLYKNTKKINAHLNEMQQNYKDDFSKEELIPFYEDLMMNVRYSLLGKKRKIADNMAENLEKQIMNYAANEFQDAMKNRAELNFSGPITHLSPTYCKAKQIEKRAIEARNSA